MGCWQTGWEAQGAAKEPRWHDLRAELLGLLGDVSLRSPATIIGAPRPAPRSLPRLTSLPPPSSHSSSPPPLPFQLNNTLPFASLLLLLHHTEALWGGRAERLVTIVAVSWGPLLWGKDTNVHIQTHIKTCTQTHMCTQTQIHMENIKQRATPEQWRCAVLPSTVVWIYWLLCGVQIHPSCKSALSGLLRAGAPVFWLLCVWASAPPLPSYSPTIIRGEYWERLGAWLAGSACSRVLAASEVICPERCESPGRERKRDAKGYLRSNGG